MTAESIPWRGPYPVDAGDVTAQCWDVSIQGARLTVTVFPTRPNRYHWAAHMLDAVINNNAASSLPLAQEAARDALVDCADRLAADARRIQVPESP